VPRTLQHRSKAGFGRPRELENVCVAQVSHTVARLSFASSHCEVRSGNLNGLTSDAPAVIAEREMHVVLLARGPRSSLDGPLSSCWQHKLVQVCANWVSNVLHVDSAQKKSSSILPSPVPNLSFKSALVRSVTKGTCVSFISKIPRFFVSICEASMTMRSMQSVFRAPSSSRSMILCGVPTPMPILDFFTVSTASFNLMCFAKSLATMQSLVWNLRKALATSAARCPPPATTSVCGELFASGAFNNLLPFLLRRSPANCSRNLGS
jgi:hypothetical protein